MQSGPSRRRFPRRKTKASVQAVYDNVVLECQLTDISRQGVGLMLRSGDKLPDSFTLVMKTGERRRTKIVWRGYPLCGGAFID